MADSAARTRHWDRSLIGDLVLAGGGTALLIHVLFIVFTKPAIGAVDPASALRAGHVESVFNSGRRRSDSELFWSPLQRGDAVFDHDRIYAAAGSSVQVVLDDQTRLTIEENSLVIVSRPGASSGPQLAPVVVEVQRGAVAGVAGASGIAIRSRTTQVALTAGAEARLRLRADQGTSVAVGPGRAAVTGGDGATTTLQTGQLQEFAASGQVVATRSIEITLSAPARHAQRYFVGQPPAIEFAWSGCGDARSSYRLDISRDPDFAQIVRSVETVDTSATLSGLPDGVAYWRVSRPRPAGECRSEERVLALVADAPPVIFQPRHGEIVYQFAGQPVPFAWSEVAGVRSYQLELRNNDTTAVAVGVTGPAYSHAALLAEGRYCAQVRSAEDARGQSPWSSRVCFRVINKPLPRAPKLFDPQIEELVPDAGRRDARLGDRLWRLVGGVAHAEATARRAIVLRWEAVPGVSAYVLDIAEDAAFKTVVVHTRVPQNFYKWATLAKRTYYWRVKSVDAEGRESEFSEVRVISPVVGEPEPSAPKNGASFTAGDDPLRVALRWTGAELVVQYDLEIARDSAFAASVARVRVREALSYSFSPERPGSYYWRVTGIDANGDRTATSAAQRFDVDLAAPRLKRPADRETVAWGSEELKVQLRWSERPVTRYEIQLSRGQDFAKVAVSQQSDQATQTVKPLGMGKQFWRVRGVEPETPWSAVASFTVVPTPPAPVAPDDQAQLQVVGSTLPVELRWQPSPQASSYSVELQPADQAPALQRTVEGQTTLVETLAPGRYRWQVRALHKSGVASPPSAARTFDVVTRILLAAPSLRTPLDGAELAADAKQLCQLTWDTLPGARSYLVEIATVASFAGRVQQLTAAATTVEIAAETAGEDRFWRVRGVDEVGQLGSWSEVRRFRFAAAAAVATTRPERAPPPPSLHAGPQAAFFYNLGQVITGRGGLELGYRLPLLDRRLGLTLGASYFPSHATASDASRTVIVDSWLHAFPIELLGLYFQPLGPIRLYGGLGPVLNVTHATVSVPSLPTLTQTGVSVGLELAGGLEWPLGPGALFGDLRYVLSTGNSGLVEINPGGLLVGLGYRFWIL